jgi:hypothetical protein
VSRKSKSTILQSIDIKVGGERIAYVTVPYTAKNIEECEANARLISVSPELLEFAEEVRRTGDTRLASMAISLIAKAKGEAP